ncbi:MAG: LptF/LptG family permease [Fibromonadaceae bacterium]|jgi:lipopolysaccharide export system permease protein|nr:LptF/LptG family permease [Fibromonadaceae bacterium]
MIIVRYVLKEHIAPFFAALFVTTFLFVINFLVEVLDKVLSKGIPAQIVLEIFVLNAVWMVGLAAPMSVLAATLMTFGRLSADREITAMQAAGVSPLVLMRPVLIFSTLLMVLLILFNNWLLPEANYRSAMLMQSITRKRPHALIDEGKLINQFPGIQLWVSRIDNQSAELYGIKIFEIGGNYPRVITADSASMEYVDMGATLMLHLKNGENHFVDPKDNERYFRIRFANQDFAIQNIDDRFERTDNKNRGNREMPIEEMWEVVKEARSDMQKLVTEFEPQIWKNADNLIAVLKNDTILPEELRDMEVEPDRERHGKALEIVKREEKEILTQITRMDTRVDGLAKRDAQYMVEIHKKISTAVACIVFALIGAPLGIIARRGGIGPGTVYSLGFFAVYWVCLIGGENLAVRLIISPALSMWACNALIGTIGLFLTWRVAKR